MNTPLFAELLEDHLLDPSRKDLHALDDSLSIRIPSAGRYCVNRTGIYLNNNGKVHEVDLFILLLRRAFQALDIPCSPAEFSEKIAASLTDFVFSLCQGLYQSFSPHFLLHGIEQAHVNEVQRKIRDNARIILETVHVRQAYFTPSPVKLEHDLRLRFFPGLSSDNAGGLVATLSLPGGHHIKSSNQGYMAKCGVFLDQTRREIVALSVQGQPHHDIKACRKQYFRLQHQLGEDPRQYLLRYLFNFFSKQGFRRFKMLKAEDHPMMLEHHKGFTGRYEKPLREIGIEEEGSYLTKALQVA